MSGFDYVIKLSLIGTNSISQANAAIRSLDGTLGHVARSSVLAGNAMVDAGHRGASSFDLAKRSLSSLVSGLAVAAFTMSSLSANAEMTGMNNAITFAGGKEGAANLGFVRQAVSDLNLDMRASMDGFKTLSGSVMGTGISTQQVKDIFTSTAEAATVMGLSADQVNGSFLALGQMASKGTVAAEELRGQLGERIPGAFNIAARAMGMSTGALGDFMKQGKLMATDFLPKFAAELHRTFGPGLATAIEGPQQQFNKFNNALLDAKVLLGETLMPVVTTLINDGFLPLMNWVRENRVELGYLAGTLGSLYIATQTYALYMGIAALATGTFTGTIWGLNLALLNNPITWVVAGIITLGGVVMYAWNHFEGFRGFLMGFWEVWKVGFELMLVPLKLLWSGVKWVYDNVIRPFGAWIYDNMIGPMRFLGFVLKDVGGFFVSLGGIIINTLLLPLKGALFLLDKLLKFAGVDVNLDFGAAFSSGWDKGVMDFNADKNGFLSFAGTNGGGVLSLMMPDRKPSVANDMFGKSTPSGGVGANEKQGKGKGAGSGLSGMGSEGGRNVTINLGKLFENITITTTTAGEGIGQIKEMLMKELLQVVNSANQTAHG